MDINSGIEPGVFQITDFYSHCKCPSCIIYGARNSGKTVFLKKLLLYFRDKYEHEVIIITGTNDPEYSSLNLPQMVYEKGTLDYLEGLYKDGYPNERKPLIMLFDDMTAFYKNVRANNLINLLFSAGRHKNIIILYVLHGVKGIDTISRDNTDIIILTKINGERAKKSIYELVSPANDDGSSMKFDEWKYFLKKYLKNYDKLFFDFYDEKFRLITTEKT